MTRSDDTGRDEELVLLPRRMDPETRRVLEGAGLKWEAERPDGFSVQWLARLPKGWRQVFFGQEHPRRRCYLVDRKGQRRALVDMQRSNQDASIVALNRFTVETKTVIETKRSAVHGLVKDGADLVDPTFYQVTGRVIHTTTDIPHEVAYESSLATDEAAWNLAVEWLDQNYPDWRNPVAYWD